VGGGREGCVTTVTSDPAGRIKGFRGVGRVKSWEVLQEGFEEV